MKTEMKLLTKLLENLLPEFDYSDIAFAEQTPPPVPDAYTPGRARLLIGVEGRRDTIYSQNGGVACIKLERGDAFFASPETWHKPLPVKSLPFSLFIIMYDPNYTMVAWKGTRKDGSRFSHGWSGLPVTPASPDIYHLVQTLDHLESPNRRTCARELVKALVAMTIDYMRATPEKLPKKQELTWNGICDFLSHNFHLPVTRETLAEHFKLHPNHISRLFAGNGETFIAFLTKIRIDHAIFLLKTSRNLSVKEVSAECGFNSVNYFCKQFRRRTGTSPGAFRNSTAKWNYL